MRRRLYTIYSPIYCVADREEVTEHENQKRKRKRKKIEEGEGSEGKKMKQKREPNESTYERRRQRTNDERTNGRTVSYCLSTTGMSVFIPPVW